MSSVLSVVGRSELVAMIQCSSDIRDSSLCICMNDKKKKATENWERWRQACSSPPSFLFLQASGMLQVLHDMMVLYDLSNLQAPARLAPVALPLPTVLVSPHADRHLWIIHSAHSSSAALATTVGQGHFSLAMLSYPPCCWWLITGQFINIVSSITTSRPSQLPWDLFPFYSRLLFFVPPPSVFQPLPPPPCPSPSFLSLIPFLAKLQTTKSHYNARVPTPCD